MLSISTSPVGARSNDHCKLSDEELSDLGFIILRGCSNYMKIMALVKLMICMVMSENPEPHENHEFHDLSL